MPKIDSDNILLNKMYEMAVIMFGGVLAAFAIRFFLIPNNVIDGGLVGIALIMSKLAGGKFFAFILIIITLPFLGIAFNTIGGDILYRMSVAVASFTTSSMFFELIPNTLLSSNLSSFEMTIAGGIVLGIGVGLSIRYGGCIDGTEILAIIINKNNGTSVGQVIFIINIFVFTLASIIYKDIATGVKSIITFIVVSFVMDTIISGFKNAKSVIIFSKVPDILSKKIEQELKLSTTLVNVNEYSSNKPSKIIIIVVSKFKLNNLKELIYSEDKRAFFIISEISEYISRDSRSVLFNKNKTSF